MSTLQYSTIYQYCVFLRSQSLLWRNGIFLLSERWKEWIFLLPFPPSRDNFYKYTMLVKGKVSGGTGLSLPQQWRMAWYFWGLSRAQRARDNPRKCHAILSFCGWLIILLSYQINMVWCQRLFPSGNRQTQRLMDSKVLMSKWGERLEPKLNPY